jgi:hypothetical protein
MVQKIKPSLIWYAYSTFLKPSSMLILVPFVLQNRSQCSFTFHSIQSKGKSVPTMLGQALRVPGGWGSQIYRQSAHKCCKVLGHTRLPPLPPGNIPGTHFRYTLSLPQGHRAAGRIKSIKNSNDTIAPATSRFAVQCLDRPRHHATTPPPIFYKRFNQFLNSFQHVDTFFVF